MGSKLRQHYQANFREHVSAPTSAFAKKQLEKMGWSEGTGLGKKRDGITTHIKVKKRKDGLGLGSSEKPDIVQANEAAGEWWKDGLGATLARLSNNKKKKKSKKEKKKGKTYTDEELFQATGGTRFGMRAGITNNLHKWVRTENSDEAAPAEVTEDSSQEAVKSEEKKSKKRKLETVDSDDAKNKDEKDDKDKDTDKKSKKEKKDKKKKKRKLEEGDDAAVDGDTKADKEKERKEKKKAKKEKKKSKSKE